MGGCETAVSLCVNQSSFVIKLLSTRRRRGLPFRKICGGDIDSMLVCSVYYAGNLSTGSTDRVVRVAGNSRAGCTYFM